MDRAEVLKTYVLPSGKKERRWAEDTAANIALIGYKDIRCAHCKAKVRLHKQRIKTGPQHHVEHLTEEESKVCIGGHYYKQEQRKERRKRVLLPA